MIRQGTEIIVSSRSRILAQDHFIRLTVISVTYAGRYAVGLDTVLVVISDRRAHPGNKRRVLFMILPADRYCIIHGPFMIRTVIICRLSRHQAGIIKGTVLDIVCIGLVRTVIVMIDIFGPAHGHVLQGVCPELITIRIPYDLLTFYSGVERL